MTKGSVSDGKDRCEFCRKTYPTKVKMQLHLNRVHMFGQHSCSNCDKRFSYPHELVTHWTESHPERPSLPCKVCMSPTNATQYVAHLYNCIKNSNARHCLGLDGHPRKSRTIRQPGDPWLCVHCSQAFDTKSERRKHCVVDHPESSSHKCQVCQKPFMSHKSMRQHMELKHGFGKFACPSCQLSCTFVEPYLEHLSTHLDISTAPCDTCHTDIGLSEYAEHQLGCKKHNSSVKRKEFLAKMKEKGIKCRHCDHICKSHVDRTLHEVEHIGYQYNCDVCGYKCAFKSRFKEHMATHDDSGVGKVCCELCGKNVSKDYLEKHIDYVHMGKKDNVTCETCGQFFEKSVTYTSHYRIHHSTDPKYACKHCGKRHGTVAALNEHSRVHKEGAFCCSYCGKALKSKTSFEAHIRIHTGEKPFK